MGRRDRGGGIEGGRRRRCGGFGRQRGKKQRKREGKGPASEGGHYKGVLNCDFAWASQSDAENHDFGGFDEGGDTFARLEAHFFGSVGGNDGGDVLLADGERDLREEAAVLDGGDPANELVAAGD